MRCAMRTSRLYKRMKYDYFLILAYAVAVSANFIYGIRINGKRRLQWERSDFLALGLMLILYFTVFNCTNDPDYRNYITIYDSCMTQIEPGYLLFETIGHILGRTYFQFRAVVIALSYTLIWAALTKADANKNLVLALYAVFPFTLDAIQIRNLIAAAIVIFSVVSLLTDEKHSKVRYTAGILIAACFHVVSLVYLMLLAVDFRKENPKNRRMLGILFLVSLTAALVMKVDPGLVIRLGTLLFSTMEEKLSYYVRGDVRWGFLLYWAMELCYLAAANLSSRCEFADRRNVTDFERICDRMLPWIHLAVACSFPLCLIHVDFYRIYRNLSLINYFLLPILLKKSGSRWKNLALAAFAFGFLLNLAGNLYPDPQRVWLGIFDTVNRR